MKEQQSSIDLTAELREWERKRKASPASSGSAFVTTTETRTFKKGQQLRLDDIYEIQGLAGGEWWTADDPHVSSYEGGSGGEDVTITEDITITIKVKRRNTDSTTDSRLSTQP